VHLTRVYIKFLTFLLKKALFDFIFFRSPKKMRGISFFSLFLMIAGQVEITFGIPEDSY